MGKNPSAYNMFNMADRKQISTFYYETIYAEPKRVTLAILGDQDLRQIFGERAKLFKIHFSMRYKRACLWEKRDRSTTASCKDCANGVITREQLAEILNQSGRSFCAKTMVKFQLVFCDGCQKLTSNPIIGETRFGKTQHCSQECCDDDC